MRLTSREATVLLLVALPNLIFALPVNTGADLEHLIPLTSTSGVDKRATGELERLVPITQVKRDLEKLVPFPPSNSKRDLERFVPFASGSLDWGRRSVGDVEVLVPVTSRDLERLVPVTSLASDTADLEERKTIPPADQLDPGSVAPDMISVVEKRDAIPPADQFDPGSVFPDNLENNNNKRQEYAHTKTVIETVIETVTGGIAIPGYPATALSQTSSVHSSTITRLPSTVTAATTAGVSSLVDTTCTDSRTSSGTRSPSTSISSSIANLSSSAKTGVSTSYDGTRTTKESSRISATITSSNFSASLSGTGDITTIIQSSTAKIYTTVNASSESESGSGSGTVKTSSSTSTKAGNPTTTDVKSSGGVKNISAPAPAPTSTSTSASIVSTHSSATTGTVEGKSTSSVKKTSTLATSTKVSSTTAAEPAMTSKIVYTGEQKVYPFTV
ncbi:217809ce-76f6-434f-aa13-56a7f15d9461 [Sclerotinia trifoliorum]|uniref:217809ce-76f6-434f-aa13-56a7f15d9461 n=1 Tax=Sclerotinia trifoliorum TaxID=28548 RepID=A0A8H2VX67_9HELO|nr:217809ce-76f6-434f-aa13-56a7f15d9461 [Sclerotinia trifoliorum]